MLCLAHWSGENQNVRAGALGGRSCGKSDGTQLHQRESGAFGFPATVHLVSLSCVVCGAASLEAHVGPQRRAGRQAWRSERTWALLHTHIVPLLFSKIYFIGPSVVA